MSVEIKATARVQTYTAAGVPESGRYIAKGDVCAVAQELVRVTYPVPGGAREAWVRTEDLLGFTRA